MARLRAAFALASVMVATTLGGWAIWRLGGIPFLRIDWDDPADWLERVPSEWAAATGLRLLGLAAAIWLASSTGLYVLTRLFGLRAALKRLEWATLPSVRRWADLLLTGGLAMAVVSTQIGAKAADPLPVLLVIDEPDERTVAPGYLPIPAPEQIPTASTTRSPDALPARANLKAVSEPIEVVVRPGDNFWHLAEQRLVALWDRPATDPEIAPYWVEVVEANRRRIRSGNPDLIFPGELVVLPPVPGATP